MLAGQVLRWVASLRHPQIGVGDDGATSIAPGLGLAGYTENDLYNLANVLRWCLWQSLEPYCKGHPELC